MRTQRVARRLLVVVATAIVAAGLLPGTASADKGEGWPRPPGSEALVEVFLEETGWTPAKGWPPGEYNFVLASVNKPVGWSEVKGKGEVPLTGGNGQPEMSLERIAAIVGVPLGRLNGLAVRNELKEQLTLDRAEIIGTTGAETPYVEAEGEAAPTSVLSLVVPPRPARPSRISSGPGGVLKVVLTMGGALLNLEPLSFSPAEPNAGTTVEFATPALQNRAEGGTTYAYYWNFGDGTTSLEAAPKHTFPAASENGTSDYEVSVEVVAWKPNGQYVAAGSEVATVPVLTTAARPPAQETPPPAIGAPAPVPTTTAGPPAQEASQRAINAPKEPQTRRPGRSVPAAGRGGLGGTGGKGRGGTAGDARGIGGRAGEREGNSNRPAGPGPTDLGPAQGRTSQPTETPVPTRTQGRAPPSAETALRGELGRRLTSPPPFPHERSQP